MTKKAKPTQLKKLLKAWTCASLEERQAFLDLISAEARARADATSATLVTPAAPAAAETVARTLPADGTILIANGRYLLPSTIERIEAIMRARKMTPTAVMSELGFSSRDTSLTRALAMKAALRLAVIAALAGWLADQEMEG